MKVKEVDINALENNPLSMKIFGDLREEEFEALKEDIQKRGVQLPIEITPENLIICGHQRVKACKELGVKAIKCIVRKDLDTADKQNEHFIKDNVLRRQLNAYQIAKAGEALEKIYASRHGGDRRSKEFQEGKSSPLEGGRTRDKVAKVFGISGKKYYHVKKAVELAEKHEDEEALQKLKEKSTSAPGILRKYEIKEMGGEKLPFNISNFSKIWKLRREAALEAKDKHELTQRERKGYMDTSNSLMLVPKDTAMKKIITTHFDVEERQVPKVDYAVDKSLINQEVTVKVGSQYIRSIFEIAKHYEEITLKVKKDYALWIDTDDLIFILAPRISED